MSTFKALLFTLFYCLARIHADHRKEEFSRIKHYELVYFQVADIGTTQKISFTVFGQQYDIELIENKDMAPSTIRHTNGLPTDADIDHEYFTSPTTKSCHYFGKVLNDNHDALQRVSLSFCNGRGIRGEVRAFNETIVIKPARYYLDVAFDSAHPHELSDEHLVYKISDFDMKGLPDEAEGIEDISSATQLVTEKNTRRRTLYNNGNNQVEWLIVVDVSLREYYVHHYGSSWYNQLYSTVVDNVNAVSSTYQAGGFRAEGIGDISINLVEIEVISSWSGNYVALEPPCTGYTDCYSDSSNSGYPCGCKVSVHDYLKRFRFYVRDYKDTSQFDAAQMMSKHPFGGNAGLGHISRMCYREWTTSVASCAAATPWCQRLMAHELGHNFGAQDMGNTNCDNDEGIMGTCSVSNPPCVYEGFSSCAKSAIKSKFAAYNGLTCLGDGVRSFSSNVDTNNNIDSNDYTSLFFALNVVDTDEDCDIYNDVLCVRNALEYNVSAWLRVDGVCENEMPVYELEVDDSNTTYFLHFEQSMKYSDSDALYPKWIISADDMLHGSQNAYCEERDLLNCSNGKWYVLRQDNGTDFVEYTVGHSMTVLNNDECVEVDEEAQKDSWMNSATSTVAVILLVLLCLLVVAGTAFCIYRKFMKKEQMKKAKQMVPDEEEMVKSNEEEEIEVDVDATNTQIM